MRIHRRAMQTFAAACLLSSAAGAAAPAPAAEAKVEAKAKSSLKWTEIAPTAGPKEVLLSKGDKTRVYHQVSADAPLEVKVTGPAKVRFQVRLALAPGAKGRVKEKFWTQVDDQKAKKRKLRLKPSKKWKAGGEAVSARKIITVKIGDGPHTVKIGLPKGSTAKLLVRAVFKPAKAKNTRAP